jgi:hypothetical protein
LTSGDAINLNELGGFPIGEGISKGRRSGSFIKRRESMKKEDIQREAFERADEAN